SMQAILSSFGAAMKDPATRFWAVEHTPAMMAAVVLAHVGRVLARKAVTPVAKRTRLLICFGLATALMILGMPWPGRPGGRELFGGLAARGESLAAFDRRCIPAGCVAPPSNTPGILGRRALPPGRLAGLGATPDFHHELLAQGPSLRKPPCPRLVTS